jgi:hypothetical protein
VLKFKLVNAWNFVIFGGREVKTIPKLHLSGRGLGGSSVGLSSVSRISIS